MHDALHHLTSTPGPPQLSYSPSDRDYHSGSAYPTTPTHNAVHGHHHSPSASSGILNLDYADPHTENKHLPPSGLRRGTTHKKSAYSSRFVSSSGANISRHLWPAIEAPPLPDEPPPATDVLDTVAETLSQRFAPAQRRALTRNADLLGEPVPIAQRMIADVDRVERGDGGEEYSGESKQQLYDLLSELDGTDSDKEEDATYDDSAEYQERREALYGSEHNGSEELPGPPTDCVEALWHGDNIAQEFEDGPFSPPSLGATQLRHDDYLPASPPHEQLSLLLDDLDVVYDSAVSEHSVTATSPSPTASNGHSPVCVPPPISAASSDEELEEEQLSPLLRQGEPHSSDTGRTTYSAQRERQDLLGSWREASMPIQDALQGTTVAVPLNSSDAPRSEETSSGRDSGADTDDPAGSDASNAHWDAESVESLHAVHKYGDYPGQATTPPLDDGSDSSQQSNDDRYHDLPAAAPEAPAVPAEETVEDSLQLLAPVVLDIDIGGGQQAEVTIYSHSDPVVSLCLSVTLISLCNCRLRGSTTAGARFRHYGFVTLCKFNSRRCYVLFFTGVDGAVHRGAPPASGVLYAPAELHFPDQEGRLSLDQFAFQMLGLGW
jgi:hypothetical protein